MNKDTLTVNCLTAKMSEIRGESKDVIVLENFDVEMHHSLYIAARNSTRTKCGQVKTIFKHSKD